MALRKNYPASRLDDFEIVRLRDLGIQAGRRVKTLVLPFRIPNGPEVRFATFRKRESTTRMLLANHLPERDILQYIRALMPPGCHYLDAGAHIGVHSIYYAKCCLAERVWAVEPVPKILVKLRATVALNGEQDRIAVLDFGVSDKPGTAKHSRRRVNMAATVLESDPDGTIQVRTIDSLRLDRLDMLKIDVEHHNFRALVGALGTIERTRPRLIVVELMPVEIRRVAIGFLGGLGYHPHRVYGSQSTLWAFRHESAL